MSALAGFFVCIGLFWLGSAIDNGLCAIARALEERK